MTTNTWVSLAEFEDTYVYPVARISLVKFVKSMGKILQEINEKDFYPRKHLIDQV